jgi:hypothetical protein
MYGPSIWSALRFSLVPYDSMGFMSCVLAMSCRSTRDPMSRAGSGEGFVWGRGGSGRRRIRPLQRVVSRGEKGKPAVTEIWPEKVTLEIYSLNRRKPAWPNYKRDADYLLRLGTHTEPFSPADPDRGRADIVWHEAVAHRVCGALQPSSPALRASLSKPLQIDPGPGGCLSVGAGALHPFEPQQRARSPQLAAGLASEDPNSIKHPYFLWAQSGRNTQKDRR